MLLQRCTLLRLRGSGRAASLSACSLNQQLDRPEWIPPPEAAAAPQSTPGTNLPTTPGGLVRWMSSRLVAELSPAFPPFPRGAVTLQNVHGPNPREQRG